MELPDVDSFIAQGEKLGYTDSALQKYVQQCIERFDRGTEKLEREAEAERAEREAERQFELEKLRLERRTDASASNSNGSQVSRTLTHKIQEFKEDSDDINSFVRRFEAQAQTLKWPKDMWPLQMSTAFHGEALRLYDRLCVDGPVDYDELKKELLIKFQCTAEGFRDQFRSAKPQKEESMKSFHARLVGLFNSWIELSKNQKTYEGLYDLLIREQILQSVSRDLAVFLRERSFQNAQEMVDSAEHYREAHKYRARRGDGLEFAGVSQSAGGGTRSPRMGGPRDDRTRFPRDRYIPGRGPREVRPTGWSRATTNRTSTSRSPEKRSPTFRRKIKCYACKGFGHIARVRANTLGTSSDKPDPRASPKPANIGILCSSTTQEELGLLELYSGTVRGKTVQVLRDTGATTAGIRADLVQDHEYLGHNQACITFGGNVETFPVARVYVDTPFYKGYLKCCVIKHPVTDLITGNIPGVQDNMEDNIPTAMVVTRSQTKKVHQPTYPTELEPLSQKIEPQVFIQYQKEDKFLQKIRESVGQDRKLKLKNNILYRLFEKSAIRQLVVPQQLRSMVLTIGHDNPLSGYTGVRNTLRRILTQFWWPGVRRDVRIHCQTCDICQRTTSKGRNTPVTMMKTPIIDEPFKCIAIDLVGPIRPASVEGHTHILTG
ncbi:uncharacterized protein LOC112560778 [Pomacea canaliculata]|uniref:uncharacterized protein LOC112560778 n=1 Tax=Pomacea canaliculata TaxID=400727 RepID=UPI000D7298FD|nr:uncharacterized protein LOC112560778 [Pomacea canaliculata]